MKSEQVTSMSSTSDTKWLGHHSRLDRRLNAAIHAPVVDERFDQKVWALIRVADAEALTTQKALRMRLGTPWWLEMLNVIAVAATIVTIAVALGNGAARPLAAALAFGEQPSDAVRVGALIASAAVLWFGLRHGSLERKLRGVGL